MAYFEGCILDKRIFIGTISFSSAGIAQLVERNLAKVEVASSRLVSRSKLCDKLSSQPGVTKLVDVADLKSAGNKKPYRFDSGPRDQI